ncbi:hypothetical protein Cni_G11916 [Canna indica]|uniref:Endonuclease/exonuclease/phosphatase domain-containing protein n=1 Tax=Canna indica TaxID=4628 RepID=A0AAQ3QBB0_9LILI|nr:hypothetical protein Cni_G11916 [Canna indica]
MSSSSGGARGRERFFFSSSPSSRESPLAISCPDHFTSMLKMITLKLRSLCSRFRWPLKRRRVRRFRQSTLKRELVNGSRRAAGTGSVVIDAPDASSRLIRLATFNAAMFSMAPAVPKAQEELEIRCKMADDRPRGILKQQSLAKAKLRVSINLPDNEISVERSKQLQNSQRPVLGEGTSRAWKGKAPASNGFDVSAAGGYGLEKEPCSLRSNRSILDVLREVGADIIALQNVKAEEEKGMTPLSELAEGLGMKYVFAESWAPEYGDAILSKWPIKRWKVQKIPDDADFRNVLKATVEVPRAGEVNFHCTHLDHLDENWRMKQINSILRSSDGPHILAGGLNSLDETDYSAERWFDIVQVQKNSPPAPVCIIHLILLICTNDILQYYEELGKPTPKVEVIKYLKGKRYLDAKNFAGECEAVVVLAKGQDVQGTCKYGTRVDYIMASPNSPYKFVPGSYGVLSSKGTSDHHIVKVDIVIDKSTDENSESQHQKKQRVVMIDTSSSKRNLGK